MTDWRKMLQGIICGMVAVIFALQQFPSAAAIMLGIALWRLDESEKDTKKNR